MSRIITFLFFILLTLQAAETSSHALVFDRRPKPAFSPLVLVCEADSSLH